MKRISCMLIATVTIFAFSSCATSEKHITTKEPGKRYITIEKPDVVWEYGKEKFKVYPNDTLEIVKVKTCEGGTGICWKVKKLETGEYGYVSAEEMQERHKVYTEE